VTSTLEPLVKTFTPVLSAFSGNIRLAIACLELAKISMTDLSTNTLNISFSPFDRTKGADSIDFGDFSGPEFVVSTFNSSAFLS
jgi:hypothetical protein